MIHLFRRFYRSSSHKPQIHTSIRFSRLLLTLLILFSLSALWACQTAGPDSGSSPAAEAAGQSEAGPGTDGGSETHGSNPSPDESTESHIKALKEQAIQLAADMRAGDFESVAALFNDQMAAALTADALREGWDAAIEPLGAYIGFVSAEAQALEAGVNVAVVEKYEGNGILIQISFDASDILGDGGN